jgi:hypothetical protein
MKHAGPGALDELEALLGLLRELPAVREKSRRVSYRAGRAFLHFHEDPQGLFADVREAGGDAFERHDVTSPKARSALADALRTRLST